MSKRSHEQNCAPSIRGEATIARERRLSPGNPATVRGSPARRAANKVVHCPSTNPNCPNTTAFKKYQKKK